MSAVPDFEAMYRADEDPWQVASSWYERRKLSLLLAALPGEHYRRGWEPGCGIGVATRALAERVDSLVASDGSRLAVERTRTRTHGLDHVEVVLSALPDVPVSAPVDLLVLAEFLYYVPDLPEVLADVADVLIPGAHVACVHWAHHPHDAFLSGPETHVLLRSLADDRGWSHPVEHRDLDFVLDVFEVS